MVDKLSSTFGTLQLRNARLTVHLGCSQEERAYPQQLRLDLVCTLPLEECIASDDLAKTVDYRAILGTLQSYCNDQAWKLLEKCASDLCATLFAEFPRIESLTIKLEKNVLIPCDGFAVELSRFRPER